jgi:hypothetical protein
MNRVAEHVIDRLTRVYSSVGPSEGLHFEANWIGARPLQTSVGPFNTISIKVVGAECFTYRTPCYSRG